MFSAATCSRVKRTLARSCGYERPIDINRGPMQERSQRSARMSDDISPVYEARCRLRWHRRHNYRSFAALIDASWTQNAATSLDG